MKAPVVLLLLALAVPAQAASFDPEAVATRLEARLTALAAAGVFSGEMLVARRGQVVRTQTFGAVKPGAIYRIASLTKGFTAGAVLLLVERGKLRLDDPVVRFFPELPAGRLRPAGHEVTVDDLLSHGSGLNLALPKGKLLPADIVAALQGADFFAPPGTQYRYSNAGYMLLGEIIRRVSGLSYEAFLRKEVLTPLALGRTGITLNDPQRPLLASGQVGTVLGLRPASDLFADWGLQELYWEGGSSGALYSTVVDMTRWLDALSSGQFLKATTQRRLFEPVIDDYARGFVVKWVKDGGDGPGRKFIWHNGSLTPHGYQSYVALVLEEGLSVVVLSNVDGSAVELTSVVEGTLLESPGADRPRDTDWFVRASLRATHVGAGVAALFAGALLLPVARRRRPWPRQLMLATGVFVGGGVALQFAPPTSFVVGVGLLGCLCGAFVARWRSGERWIRGEAALSVFVAGVVLLVMAALVVKSLVLA